MDVLDLFAGRYDKICTGIYFAGRPRENTTGVPIDYEWVDPTEWHYQRLFSNLVVKDATTAAIKTKDGADIKVGEYIKLQDGRYYTVAAIQQDYSAASREAFRYLKDVAGVEYVIRLIEKDDPWGIR